MADSAWKGVAEFEAALKATIERADQATRAAVEEGSGEFEKIAKRNASGRPGPNVVTGTLRRGITQGRVTRWGARGWRNQVGPTVIYSRRVELQYGYPFFVPAYHAMTGLARDIFARHWRSALAG